MKRLKQEKVTRSKEEPIKEQIFEPQCGGCGNALRKVERNYKNWWIWRCENEKCGRKEAGVVIEENEKPPNFVRTPLPS